MTCHTGHARCRVSSQYIKNHLSIFDHFRHILREHLFIYLNIFITLLAIGYFVFFFMTSICIKYENTYLNNNYHIYNSYMYIYSKV